MTLVVSPSWPEYRKPTAAMLAAAFRNDPALAYIMPNPRKRIASLPRLFELLIDSDSKNGMCLTTPDYAAAALWRPPGHARVGITEMLANGPQLLSIFGSNLGRALRVAHAIESRFPSEPFWYLHYAGCEPTQQGQGLGSAVVLAGLEYVGGSVVYLETAREENIAFYRKLGFSITSEWSAGRDGPRFWSMKMTRA